MATSLKSVRATAIASVLVAAGTSSGVKITSLTYANSATAANPAGGETVTVTGSGFNSGAKVYIDTLECTTTFVSSTSLTFTSPVKTVASYMLYVYNTDGSSGVYPIGITYSNMPVWVTASGALPGVILNGAYSQTVSATGDGTITYNVTSGSLPSGISLNSSTGAITGTAPGTVSTSTFTITASDSQNQKTSRSFSILVGGATTAVEYLVIAGGGGGGGNQAAGGGGAGGYITATGLSVTAGTPITVTVGAGGAGGITNSEGSNGSISVFGSITSIGGGGGGTYAVTLTNTTGSGQGYGKDGGSGGGAACGRYSDVRGGTASAGQGNNGGDANEQSPYLAGGGGGAGSAGSGGTGQGTGTGNGGNGLASSITGSSVTYAGGGGGSKYQATGWGTGGSGGGGAGTDGSVAPGAGTANTGSGGGGAERNGSYTTGGAGGSGVVIIRYPDTYPEAYITTGSPTLTNPTGYRVYKWTSSGSITF